MNHHLPCPKIIRGQEDLTPEQAAYARQFAQERIVALLSTAPIDEEKAEEHLRDAYRVAGLEPVPVRWFDSPIAFVLALFSSLSELDSMLDDVRDSVRDRVWASVEANVWDNVEDILEDGKKDSVWGRVGERVQHIVGTSMWNIEEARVWGSVGISMWKSMWDGVEGHAGDSAEEAEEKGNVLDRIEASEEDSVRAYYYEHEHSFYRFLHEMFEENEMIHLALFNEMVSGYRLGSEEAWLVRKPIRLERDAQGRLHSADGMCIQYQDGWGFYAWHGTMCPEHLILHPEQLTKEEWMNEQNLEIRRAMQELMGNERFVELVGGRCIEQGRRADLIEVDLGNDPEKVARFVRVKDTSTERVYYLRVPPTLDKADEALAWTFGLEEQDYQPIQEA